MSNNHPENDKKWEKIAQDDDSQEELLAEEEQPELAYASREELENQLNELEAKYNDTCTKLQYVQAEFDNFRKRSERDVNNAYKFGPEKLINELLAVVD